MGAVIYYGRCRGGPFNTKRIAHGVSPYRIAYDPGTNRALVGQQAPTAARPCVFGDYVFDMRAGEWLWDDDSVSADRETAKPVHNPDDEKTP
jgi:hypothetical protein